MAMPPPVKMGAVLDGTADAEELRRTVEKLKKENKAFRKRIAELERKG
jgi:hypothetical protein